MPRDGTDGLRGLGMEELAPRAYESFGPYRMTEDGLFVVKKARTTKRKS